MESIQRQATRVICGSEKEYQERLGVLKAPSLELRRKFICSVQIGLQNRKRATKFAGHPTEVQLRSPIKKIFEEHEKTTIKALRSTNKRNIKTRSKSKPKKTAVPTADLARLPFLQMVKTSRDTKKCTDNCSESKAETGAKKDPHAKEMKRTPAKGCNLLPIIHRSTITIKKVKEMPRVIAKEEGQVKKRKTKKVARSKSTGEVIANKNFAPKIKPRAKSCRQKRAKQILCTEKLVMEKPTQEKLAKETLLKKQLITKRLTKGKLHTEGLQVETFTKEKKCNKTVVNNELLVGEKFASSEPSPSSDKMPSKPLDSVHSILLSQTKSAIAFKVLTDGEHNDTVVLSARVPRRLRKLDNPPQLTAEMVTAKQLAVQENRLKELERVRNCARACSRPVERSTIVHLLALNYAVLRKGLEVQESL
ncbi:hypothetical protein AWC38_SpisGene19790 [Stylophora pistillata]|uniref:Uncharacterized protein n=1 Tax=Stylophora pistillata TaxID=50429 RepID=A0A2B4RI84_STYPI|nr:hypothetical protein AWC38_SpisGene19790 [Stylophora pistillata]